MSQNHSLTQSPRTVQLVLTGNKLGHIAGARPIPLKELPERVGELAEMKGRDVVAICRVGMRSATAAAILTGLGFEHVWNLKGGMIEWTDARLSVERGG